MPNMFGFSRRRMKLGRLKGHQSDPLHSSGSPATARHLRVTNGGDPITTSVSSCADDLAYRWSSDTFDLDGRALDSSENWAVLSTEGDKPAPHFAHAAAIVGSKMVVFGGDSGHRFLDDTKILNLEKLVWDSAAPKVRPSPSGRSLKLSACKGHRLVPWGNSIILVGGKSEPAFDRLSVWTFNAETEIWSLMEAKGDIPVARSGHTVIRAGARLILFGGKDTKGKKRHDLHMFDLKSLTWLPLNYKVSAWFLCTTGTRLFLWLLEETKKIRPTSSRSAPDVDPLLYEYSPSTRELADHLNKCDPLYSNSSVARHSLTSTVEHPPRRESRSESLSRHPVLGTSHHRQFHLVEECSLAQKLQKPINNDKYDDADDCSTCPASTPKEHRGKRTGADIQIVTARVSAHKEENSETEGPSARRIARSSSDISHLYNTKITYLIRINAALEEQLAAVLTSKDQAEKNLSLVINGQEQLEKRLANKGKEAELLKEKIAGLELAQENPTASLTLFTLIMCASSLK